MEYDGLLIENSVSRPASDSIYKVAYTKLPPDTKSQDYLNQNSSIKEPTEEAGHEQGDCGADAEDQCFDGGGKGESETYSEWEMFEMRLR